MTDAFCGWVQLSDGRLIRQGLQGDLLAGDLFQLADQRAFPAPLVDVVLVEVRAEVAVAGVGVGEQVPDDREHRVADSLGNWP